MSDITYRSNLDRDLTPNEVDENFRSLDDTKTEVSVTTALAADVALLEASQAIQDEVLARLGTAVEALDGNVSGLGTRMDTAETNITAVTDQANATQQALQLHELDNSNPHEVTAEQTGADVAGTANAVMQTHLAAADPHPEYLTPLEADGLYDTLGSAAQAQAASNAISINGVPTDMTGAVDGFVLTVVGAPGNEQVMAVPASSVVTDACKVEIFTASSTYIKPPGAKSVHLLLIGGGQGGENGNIAPAGGTALGGRNGSGGAKLELVLDAALFSATSAVVVGMGGIGSDEVTWREGGNSTIVINGMPYAADGGSLRSSSGMFLGGNSEAVGSAATGLRGRTASGAPAGGTGAGVSEGSSWNGGNGTYSLSTLPDLGIGVANSGGVAPGGDGLSIPGSAYENYKYPGVSGGGGSSSYNSNGGDGGAGGDYGAGGGGGGAAADGFQPGNGGDGGDGVIVITTYF